ncbi:MAG: hypothetical protein NDI84_03000 [Steroidobacteraceae bacterium]|nr:hypothetical protein [Steroidobacteraceae bacterium]
MTARSTTTWASLVAMLLGSACDGSGEGLDANGRPLGEGGAPQGELTADFASIQAHVFTPVCTQCHAGAAAPMGLRLDAANSYGSLVGVASGQVPGMLRVRPGDPAGSYLVQKLEGRAAVGARMPFGLPALPDATIRVIRQWISDGAQPAASAETPLFAVSTAAAMPHEVAIELSRSLDAALVNDTTVRLERLRGDGVEVDVVAARVTVSRHNPRLLLLQPRQPLAPGRYRVQLRGNDGGALADWNGTRLDGDGDGIAGGDGVVELRVGSGQ